LIVAIGLATLQVAVLIGLSALRGGAFHVTGTGVAWFVGAALLFTVFMYGVAELLAAKVHKEEDYVGATPAVAILPFFFAGALFPIGAMPAVLTGIAWFVAAALLFTVFMYGLAETLAARVTKQEDYVGATPAVAILPFFFAGALFPITAMPGVLTAIAKAFPLTHALALMRYGFIDPSGKGLHDIWGMHSATAEAWLSLAVVALWAVALTAISIRVFSRSAVS
ncbi:MAG: ABC transporter permease, partial [Solirubrobacterales bacterium]|nr:ABC transporter permease [Solirubrobacterales bacterium]